MADIEIAGKDFVNYTDCRPQKKELSAIEKEKLADFVKALTREEQIELVKHIEDWEILQNEVTRKHRELVSFNKGIEFVTKNYQFN